MLEEKTVEHEKVVLIGVTNREQNEERVREYLDELQFLTFTAGGEVEKRFVQRVELPNPKTYIGSGKMLEVEAYVKENEIGSVIFLNFHLLSYMTKSLKKLHLLEKKVSKDS